MTGILPFSPYLCEVLIFAASAHGKDMRKGGNIPYIVHPVEAALIAMSLTDDREIIAAALLHDTVEDTSVSVEDIRLRFGERVARLVEGETENKRRHMSPSESWYMRKNETLSFIDTASSEQKILVLADKLSNIRQCARDLKTEGTAFWNKFNNSDSKDQEWYYRSIASKLGEFSGTDAYEEFLTLTDIVFGS